MERDDGAAMITGDVRDGLQCTGVLEDLDTFDSCFLCSFAR